MTIFTPESFGVSRVESWRVELLDAENRFKRDMPGVLSGSIEMDRDKEVAGGGSLEIAITDASEVDWLRDRLRVLYKVNGIEWSLGTFLPIVPGVTYSEDFERLYGDQQIQNISVELIDTLTVIAEDRVAEGYSVHGGTSVSEALTTLIDSTGEQHSITETSETLIECMSWLAGTSKLRIANDLLQTINYFSLRSGESGRLIAAPYQAPTSRVVAWRFRPSEYAIHSADMYRNVDLYELPNRVVLITNGTEEEEALVAVAENNDPDDPLSIPARSRTITYVEEGVEATSQDVLNALAERKLRSKQTEYATIEISHAPIPLRINDLVEVELPDRQSIAVVQSTSVPLEVGGQSRTTLVEVQL